MKNILKPLLFLFLATSFHMSIGQQRLPAFYFTDLNEKVFSLDNLQKDMPTLAIFFDPYCDHCAKQADWISEAAEKFKNVQMIWVTTEGKDAALQFYNDHLGNSGLEHTYVLMDKEFMFDTYFGYSEAPTIYIYNTQAKRVKTLSKETSAQELLEFIERGER